MTHLIQSALTILRAGEWMPVTAARLLIGIFFCISGGRRAVVFRSSTIEWTRQSRVHIETRLSERQSRRTTDSHCGHVGIDRRAGLRFSVIKRRSLRCLVVGQAAMPKREWARTLQGDEI